MPKKITIKEILGLIDNDISYQKTHLEGDSEKDKPIKWRITGMEYLKKEILKGEKILREEKCQ